MGTLPGMSAEAIDVRLDRDSGTLRASLAVKRAIDVAIGTVGLVLAAPLLLALSMLIALTSRGPVLYRQQRIGRDGRAFALVKFRTMRHGTHDEVLSDPALRAAYEANGWKLPPDDPRITRLGRWLRRTSLDELPQLWNVVVGHMSLVGIRPLLADELARRPESDQQLYRTMRPGMTGLWQVEGRSSLDDVDRLALDRAYVEHWSLRRDLVLLARTPAALLRLSHAH
jgi:lipopolysaccharide/colanic/teichoic acid biosynthesis glycosyltransferase